MAEPAHAILSEEFQERLEGRTLVSAVFLTYQFDPAFFEQEILPVFIDLSGSHVPAIRLVQLEEAIQRLSGHLAVYYDAGALVAGGSGSAKLDVRRIPVRHGTGVFHPKNVFALVEANAPDEDGHKPRALVAAALSANLTRGDGGRIWRSAIASRSPRARRPACVTISSVSSIAFATRSSRRPTSEPWGTSWHSCAEPSSGLSARMTIGSTCTSTTAWER